MKEILRTNNPALISRLRAMLDGAGLTYFIADYNASILEGSIGALPQRLLVADDEALAARRLIVAEGLAEFLPESEVPSFLKASISKAPQK